MRPHVGAKTLARYRQGDLSQRRSSRIGAHLGKFLRNRYANVPAFAKPLQLPDRVQDQLPNRAGPPVQLYVPGFNARHLHGPVQQSGQTVGFLIGDGKQFALHRVAA